MSKRVRTHSRLVVGVDLGGTNMQIGAVNQLNRIISRVGRKTKAELGKKKVIERIAEGIERACEDAKVDVRDLHAVGIAAPGAIDIPHGIVLEAPNLKWTNVPLRDIMRERLGCKVVIDNDVNAAVWGESELGAGVGRKDCLGVWVGTGVGGGLVLNGHLYYGEFFTAGEIGQTVLMPPPIGKGRSNTRLEDFCSRTGMARLIKERLQQYPKSVIRELTDGTGNITGSKQLAEAYRRNDPLATQVVNEGAEYLGIAIANWITVLALDTIIVGGGVTEALGKPYLDRIRDSFKRHVFPQRCAKAKLLMTKLADDAGLLGAALLARA